MTTGRINQVASSRNSWLFGQIPKKMLFEQLKSMRSFYFQGPKGIPTHFSPNDFNSSRVGRDFMRSTLGYSQRNNQIQTSSQTCRSKFLELLLCKTFLCRLETRRAKVQEWFQQTFIFGLPNLSPLYILEPWRTVGLHFFIFCSSLNHAPCGSTSYFCVDHHYESSEWTENQTSFGTSQPEPTLQVFESPMYWKKRTNLWTLKNSGFRKNAQILAGDPRGEE